LPENVLPSSLRLTPDLVQAGFVLNNGAAPDVWANRRDGTGLVQLTVDPEDDSLMDWLPDGSGVLVRTLRDSIRADYAHSIGIVRPDGAPFQVVTSGPWMEKDLDISPDGSELLVARQLGDHSIWRMDLDGSDALPLLTGLGRVTLVAWSPTAEHAAFIEWTESGQSLRMFRLDDPSSLRTVVTASGLAFAWSPNGSRIYYSATVEGNQEVFSAALEGGDPTRLTYSEANEAVHSFTSPSADYAETVEVLNTAPLYLLAGDTAAIQAVVWSAAGDALSNSRPALTCLDPAVCVVTEGNVLRTVGPGRTSLVADLGGWRADTLDVVASAGTPNLLLEEDWENGINPDLWNSVGSPAPSAIPGIGRDRSHALVNNGDDKFSSGVVSVEGFDWTVGLTVEVWGRGDFEHPTWPSFQAFAVGLRYAPQEATTQDISLPTAAKITVGRDHESGPATFDFREFTSERPEEWSPAEWHHYAVQFYPTGTCEAWIDGTLLARAQCQRPPTTRLWVVLDGRMTHSPVVHDAVRVSSGILLRSEPAEQQPNTQAEVR
jgi:hypothetical protein